MNVPEIFKKIFRYSKKSPTIYSRSGTYECILEQYHISFTYVSLLKDIQLKVFLLHAYLLVDPLDCITFSKIVRTLNFI